MDAKVYAVPMGIVGNQLVQQLEVYVPDILLAISPSGENIAFPDKEIADEKYDRCKELGSFTIPTEDEELYKQYAIDLAELQEREVQILQQVVPVLEKIAEEINDKPHIQIATPSETAQVLQDSKIIVP